MDTDRLKYFTLIAETGSLTRASRILGISHSGLSKAMSALESETKLKLFQPQGRGLEITQNGKWFYIKAQEILKMTDELTRGEKPQPTLLRLGLSGVIAMTCAGALGAELNLPLQMSEIDVGEVEAKIIGGELDFGVAFIPAPKPELEYLPLGTVIFNSFAREDLIERKKSGEIPYAVPTSEYPNNPLGYKNRDGWPKDTPRKPFYSVSNFAVALSLLREGQAAVYMPEYIASQENSYSASSLKIVKIKDHAKAETRRQLFLIKSLSALESKEMKKVAKIIRKHCCAK